MPDNYSGKLMNSTIGPLFNDIPCSDKYNYEYYNLSLTHTYLSYRPTVMS